MQQQLQEDQKARAKKNKNDSVSSLLGTVNISVSPSSSNPQIETDNKNNDQTNKLSCDTIFDYKNIDSKLKNGKFVYLNQQFVNINQFQITSINADNTVNIRSCTDNTIQFTNVSSSWIRYSSEFVLSVLNDSNEYIPVKKNTVLKVDCINVNSDLNEQLLKIPKWKELNDKIVSSDLNEEVGCCDGLLIDKDTLTICIQLKWQSGDGIEIIPGAWLKLPQDYEIPVRAEYIIGDISEWIPTGNRPDLNEAPPIIILPKITQNDGAFSDDEFDMDKFEIRANLTSTKKYQLETNDKIYVFNKTGSTSKARVIYWEEDFVTVDIKNVGRMEYHIQGVIHESQNCCTIYHPVFDIYVPVYEKQIIFYDNESYRVSDAKFDSKNEKWIIKCNEIDNENVQRLLAADDVKPIMASDWLDIKGKFFCLDDSIMQLDGGNDDYVNIGDELNSYLKYFESNEAAIQECVEEIETNGIDLTAAKKHARFDSNGFANKARQKTNISDE